MKSFCHLGRVALGAGVLLGACVHTPPGTSVEIALAKKAQLIRLPQAPPKAASRATYANVPPIEPELPIMTDRIEAVADAFTRGKFAMKDHKDAEAIAAFEETVKLDPTHSEAWQDLALLYEKRGDEKKALAAFRNAKKIARQ
jgi:Flp pilus assembly protein TadD